jgi:hypothetical protein
MAAQLRIWMGVAGGARFEGDDAGVTEALSHWVEWSFG